MKKTLAVTAVLLATVLLTFGGMYAYKKIMYRLYPREFADLVSEACAEFGVPEPLVYAVIKTESSFEPSAVSSAGARGLMQLMPDTFAWLSKKLPDSPEPDAVDDPKTNLRVGVSYLAFLYERFGSWEVALAGYNAGHGRVSGWLDDARYSSDGKTLDEIPIKETKDYVNRVISSRDVYIKLYYGEN